MEQWVFMSVFAAFILVSFLPVQGLTKPGFKTIPLATQEDFEVREYVSTEWITTNLTSLLKSDVVAAHDTLEEYCKTQGLTGLFKYSWPALITSTEDGSHLTFSWFVPPGTTTPLKSDASVKVERRAAATVYVKAYSGIPDVERSRDTTAELQDAVERSGKRFNRHSYTWACYRYTFSIQNEVWLYAAA